MIPPALWLLIAPIASLGVAWLVGETARGVVERRLVAAALITIAVAGTTVTFWPDDALWTTFYTPLQEGRTGLALELIHGRGAHVGPLVTAARELASHVGGPGVAPVVRLNALLMTMTVVLFGALGAVVLSGRWLGLAAAVVYVANPASVLAVLSAQAGAFVGLLVVLAAIVIGAFDRLDAASRSRPIAVVSMALLAALLGACRIELLAPAGLATLVLAARVWAPTVIDSAFATALALLSWLVRRPAGLLVALAVGWTVLIITVEPANMVVRHWLPNAGVEPLWIFDAITPLNLDVLLAPIVSLRLLPLGVTVLGCVGLIVALLQGRRFALAGLSLMLLSALYGSSGHGHAWEFVRYSMYTTPLFLLLALHGWPAIAKALAKLAGSDRALRPTAAVIGALIIVPIVNPGTPRFDSRLAYMAERDTQREVHFLMDTIAARPDCLVFVPLRPREGGDQPWGVVGGGLQQAVRGPSPRWLQRRLAPTHGGHCAVLFEGLDCHLVDAPDCSAETRDLKVIAEFAYISQPFVADHIAIHKRAIRLRSYELPLP